MSEKVKSAITYEEIYHQTASFKAINDSRDNIFSTLDRVFEHQYDELIFTGCGTSLYLAQTCAFMYSSSTGKPAKAVPCSELYFFPDAYLGDRKVLVLPITRKSYTTEVRMAIDKVHTYPNVKTLSITCDEDSKKYNDYMIFSPDADEKSVIMTGTFTSMIYLGSILALYVSGKKEQLNEMMTHYGSLSEKMLSQMDTMAKKIVEEHPHLNLYIMLGQGAFYGVANECMNKVKEMGIANSEGYYSMEYRHGPMSLVDENTLIMMLGSEMTRETDVSLLSQMKGFGGVTAAIGKCATKDFQDADYTLDLPENWGDVQYAAAIGFIGQFIGYYIARQKDIDADTPRHLSQAIVLK